MCQGSYIYISRGTTMILQRCKTGLWLAVNNDVDHHYQNQTTQSYKVSDTERERERETVVCFVI